MCSTIHCIRNDSIKIHFWHQNSSQEIPFLSPFAVVAVLRYCLLLLLLLLLSQIDILSLLYRVYILRVRWCILAIYSLILPTNKFFSLSQCFPFISNLLQIKERTHSILFDGIHITGGTYIRMCMYTKCIYIWYFICCMDCKLYDVRLHSMYAWCISFCSKPLLNFHNNSLGYCILSFLLRATFWMFYLLYVYIR